VSACVLHLNGLLPDDAVLDPISLRRIAMPNRGDLGAGSWPDVPFDGR
jgi:cytochrome c